MNIYGAPMLGTPKQNSFIIKLGSALGNAELRTAFNVGMGKHEDAPWPPIVTMNDASTVITNLLEACKKAGISTFQGKGGGKKRKGKKGKGEAPAPAEQQPLPTPEGRSVSDALRDLGNATQMLLRRGCTQGEISSAIGHLTPWIDEASTEALCAELERRGLPGRLLLADPDAVAVADRALELLEKLWTARELRSTDDHSAEKILLDSGRSLMRPSQS